MSEDWSTIPLTPHLRRRTAQHGCSAPTTALAATVDEVPEQVLDYVIHPIASKPCD